MITSPESNVLLSDEQTKQLQVFYTRLTNLQTETSIATKNLETLKQETIKVALEKKYTEDTLEGLKQQIQILKDQAGEHITMVARSQEELEAHRKERVEVDTRHAQKHDDLSVRERTIEEREEAHTHAAHQLSVNSSALSEERLSVEKAKDAFVKAAESVTWK